METDYNAEELQKNEKIIDVWGRRAPYFEKRYEQSVLRVLATYGLKAGETTEAKGKILGAAYEPLIMAFFIGLYSDKKIPLPEDSDDIKTIGHQIMFWGNNANRLRRAYPRLREYIFNALVARTEIDWIALDKGEIKVSEVVSKLMTTMQEYINYGLSVIEEKLKEDKSYFYSQRSFLDMFLQLTEKDASDDKPISSVTNDVEPL